MYQEQGAEDLPDKIRVCEGRGNMAKDAATRFKEELRFAITEAATAEATAVAILPEVATARTEILIESQAAQNATSAHLTCYKNSMRAVRELEAELESSRSETQESSELLSKVRSEVNKGPSLSMRHCHGKMCEVLRLTAGDVWQDQKRVRKSYGQEDNTRHACCYER